MGDDGPIQHTHDKYHNGLDEPLTCVISLACVACVCVRVSDIIGLCCVCVCVCVIMGFSSRNVELMLASDNEKRITHTLTKMSELGLPPSVNVY